MTENKKKINIFKKGLILLFALIFALIPLFAGCDLVTLNEGKYLTQSVAKWKEITVNKEDLIRTYNNYGNSNYDNSETPTRDGVEKTIDLLVKRAILVDYLTDPANGQGGNPIVNLTMAQQNSVWRSVYESINSSVRSIESDIRADEEQVLLTGTDEEEESASEYEPYKHTYVYENGTLTKVQEDEVVENESIALYDKDSSATYAQKAVIAYNKFKESFLNYTEQRKEDGSDYTSRAFSKYSNNLLKNEEGRNLSNKLEEAFLREVDRIYKIYYDNEILTVYQEQFEKTVIVNVDMVKQKFEELYDAQLETYEMDSSSYKTNMQSTSTTAYYNPSSEVSNWFEVYHLLVGFSDEQTTEISNLKTMLSNGEIVLEEYNRAVADVKNRTMATNKYTGEKISYTELSNKIQNALSGLDGDKARIAKFREFVYAYSTDTNSINVENGMYIPLNKDDDNMVEPFANASRDLYNAGIKGAISGLVETTYGFHIIMYTGDVANVVYTNNTTALVERLNSTLLTNTTNKTMLDKVIEQISLDTYYNHEQSLLNQIMDGVDITYYLDAYKDMFE